MLRGILIKNDNINNICYGGAFFDLHIAAVLALALGPEIVLT